MLPPDVRVIDYDPGSDHAYWGIMHACFGNQYGDLEFWRGKHLRRPGFDVRDVKRVCVGGIPAACLSASTALLCLESNLFVPTSVEGEVAVLPEFRGRGLILSAHCAMGNELYHRGVVLRIGFGSHALQERFYRKRFGSVGIPTLNTRYKKSLRGSTRLTEAALGYADVFRRSLVGRRLIRYDPLTLALRIEGYSPVAVRIAQDAAVLAPRGARPDVLVAVSNRAARAVTGRWRARTRIPQLLLKGEMRVHGMARVARRLVWR